MINQICDKIIDDIDFEKRSQTVSYLNIYNYQILRKTPKIIEKIDYFTLDGIMLLLFIQIFMGKRFNRMAPDFSSYFAEFFGYLERNNKRVVFIGGSENDMSSFIKTVKENYPQMNIIDTYNGFDLDEDHVINGLISKEVDCTIVGMGTPKQESFIVKARKKGYEGSSFCCGAFMSQTANKGRDYFPSYINRLHLRWAYRIYKEPKLFKRYSINYPKGLSLLFLDRYFK
ncbi:MAG: WecB/TagA/CpsF family glycosyltransferase [Muricauda sp.]|nr:WecB/TagA/CpsF family glycosyltransferase [Allomuricauda sp.]MBA4745342.1 WecB/TagA/CpsF family glycosyltransferase [Allomuricauda sp.]